MSVIILAQDGDGRMWALRDDDGSIFDFETVEEAQVEMKTNPIRAFHKTWILNKETGEVF